MWNGSLSEESIMELLTLLLLTQSQKIMSQTQKSQNPAIFTHM